MFLKEVSYANQCCIYLIKNTVSNILKYIYILISSVHSLHYTHDPSEIILIPYANLMLRKDLLLLSKLIKKKYLN